MLKVAGGGGGGGGSGTVTSVGTGTGLTGGPITTSGNISLANTSVTAGSYGTANAVSQVTVNAQGQITSAANVAINIAVANVSGAVPNTVNVLAGTGMSGGGALTGNVTLNLANTAVAAGSYGTANTVSQITVDAQGRITSAANVAISIASANVTGLGTMATQNANDVNITGGNVVANVTVQNALSASATYQTSSLPLVPAGYIQIQLSNATVVKVPYYAA